MASEWKVSSNSINGKTMYIPFRLIDEDKVDHSGNREYYGPYLESKEDAERMADILNMKDR